MINYTSGDILKSESQALVNTVNCEGYMGKGIAYQFRLKYPGNNKAYEAACRTGSFKPGNLLTFEEDGKIIINFPTKNKWRKKSEYEFIENGLIRLAQWIRNTKTASVSIPPLGCGNGGLDWREVKKLMLQYLGPVSNACDILIYEPFRQTNIVAHLSSSESPPTINTSHLLLMYLKVNLKKFNKLRIQKAAYLINVYSGHDYFTFEKHHFSPHAHFIDILSREIKEYQDFYNVTTVHAIETAFRNVISKSTSINLSNYLPFVEKVSEVVNSFESDLELELFTTLLFLIQKHREVSLEEIVDEVHNWNEHKRTSFRKESIEATLSLLEKSGLVKRNLMRKYESPAA